MSATEELTKLYASFFHGAARFAALPYISSYRLFSHINNPRNEEPIAGIAGCLFFTAVIPILPELTSITATLAIMASIVAFASMLVLYPLATLVDAIGGINEDAHMHCRY